ncbi:MAG: tetratricopeptide repeat protein, partial [Desulfobacteraceae bacterium]|nr:tetratricopeptide repeat protein [Desulfobacteraceae bacterium]
YLAKSQYRKAIEDFATYLLKEENPERISDACYNIANAYVELGEYNAAIDRLNLAIVKNPLNFETWVLRGLVYKSKLDYGPALRDLQRGFSISGNTSILASNSIAWILATCPNPDFRNGAEALKMARLAVEQDGSKPYYHDTLAAACAEGGLFKEAVEEQKTALKLLAGVPEPQRGQIAARYEKRLKLYAENKPFRDVEE